MTKDRAVATAMCAALRVARPRRQCGPAAMRLLTSALFAALLGPTNAQQPARWADLHLPAGVVATQLQGQGKLITYREGTTLRVFSAFTRRWHALTAGSNATTHLHNDCLLVQDGLQWTAFSAYTGAAAPLTVSATATLHNSVGNHNDSILLVEDGSLLLAFSCFTGTWVARTLPANSLIDVRRHVAVMKAATLVSALDAYTGQWHDMTVTNAPLFVNADGTAGFAVGATEVHGFSALHRSWQTATFNFAGFTRNADWALFQDSTSAIAYSSVRGAFVTSPYGPLNAVYSSDHYVLGTTIAGMVAFSAPRGAFSLPLAPTLTSSHQSDAVALFLDSTGVRAYSAISNTATTLAIPQAQVANFATAGAVGWVLETAAANTWCYSGLSNSWHRAPTNTLPAFPLATATSVLLASTSGAYAFGARSGTFVPLTATAPILVGNSLSSVAAAWEPGFLHAFDGRTETWRSVPRTSTTAPIVQIWRTTMSIVDGMTVHGFGAQEGTWSSRTLAEPFVFATTNSESGRVVTATHVLAHSPIATLATFAQFPEFRRVQPHGSSAGMALHLPGGGSGVLAGGILAPTPTAVPGLGELWLQPILATTFVAAVPSTEHARFDLLIPADPALVGVQLGFQALTLPASGGPSLTGAASLYVL